MVDIINGQFHYNYDIMEKQIVLYSRSYDPISKILTTEYRGRDGKMFTVNENLDKIKTGVWPPMVVNEEINLSKEVTIHICHQSNGNISYTYYPRNSGFGLHRFESYDELLSVHQALSEFIEKTKPKKQETKNRFADIEVIKEDE